MTSITLADLQVSVQDKLAFTRLDDYRRIALAFLNLLEEIRPTRIISPSHHNYVFFQFGEDYGHNITRPLNTNLIFESPLALNDAFERFAAFLSELKRYEEAVVTQEGKKQYIESREINRVTALRVFGQVLLTWGAPGLIVATETSFAFMRRHMGYDNVMVEREEGIGIITVNRPSVLNALNNRTIGEIGAAADELIGDEGVRAIIITGAGEKSFVAGADINEIRAMSTPAEAEMRSNGTKSVFFKIEESPKPVIMAINGFALGGGCELAMAGDIRIAADTARFGQPEINLGVIPGAGGTQRLPRLVGKGTAVLMILTGEMIDAQEALRIGLVDRVVPAAELMPTAKKIATAVANKAPLAVRAALRSVKMGLKGDLQSGCALEAAQFGMIIATEDRVEGTSAFLEKRKPIFKGR